MLGAHCSGERGSLGGETEETGGSRSTTLLPVFLFLCSCLIGLSFYIVFVFDCAVLYTVFFVCSSFIVCLGFPFYILVQQ